MIYQTPNCAGRLDTLRQHQTSVSAIFNSVNVLGKNRDLNSRSNTRNVRMLNSDSDGCTLLSRDTLAHFRKLNSVQTNPFLKRLAINNDYHSSNALVSFCFNCSSDCKPTTRSTSSPFL